MKWTIQFKLVLLFSGLVFLGFTVLIMLSGKVGVDNLYGEVDEDMGHFKKNLDIAVNQYFLIHNLRMSEKTLAMENAELTGQIGSAVGGKVTLFRPDGTPLQKGDASGEVPLQPRSDVTKTDGEGKVVYTTYVENNRMIARLTFPLTARNSVVGILQFDKDYSDLYERHVRYQETIKNFAALIFGFVFLASVLISKKITNPIRVLTRRSAEVAQGNLVADIRITTRDEIGELATSFAAMIRRIREQIDVIERERDEVKQVQARSKTFFDNVTHELKTPLTTILGYAQILKDNGFTDRVYFDKGLDYIIKESRRLNGMVADILEVSVSSNPLPVYRFEVIDAAKVVWEACEDMSIKANKYNIHIQYKLEERLEVQGDRHKLKEVFLNVLDNAIKYGYVNSSIIVEAFREDAMVAVLITDQGEGISPEALKLVFEPFYRVSEKHRNEKGSAGLGLSIVKQTVESHGGRVEMDSELKKGTRVKILLPEDRHGTT
ncbi:sensor histidine kinase [Paenibacillus sp. A14]|uniref:sensor histidine kinase n=1 Tax=Paenibacillus sp. A14 TaxID=3119820 RepID=UPI002FE27EB3